MAIVRHAPFEHGTAIEILEGEETVSRLLLWELEMRIGHVPIRCGGIGDVSTDWKWRMKGYARRLMVECLDFMGMNGYVLSVLFGIPDFYSKFGFAPALVECESTIATRDAEKALARYPVRPVQPEDAPAVATMYNTRHANRSGSIVRDPAHWQGPRFGAGWSKDVGSFVVLDKEQGQVIGYATHNTRGWHFTLSEVGYRDSSVLSTILAEAARQAIALRVEKIAIHSPPDDPFVHYCRRYGCETTISYERDSGGMVRVIDLKGLLSAIRPVLAERLRAAERVNWAGALEFQADLCHYSLSLGDSGEPLLVNIPQWMLAQWVLGFRDVETSLRDTEVHVDDRAVPILQALFPPAHPYTWAADRI